jgi:hypothetical protein
MKAVELARCKVPHSVKITMLFVWAVSPPSALKMETVFFSENLIGLSTYESTRRHNSQGQHRRCHTVRESNHEIAWWRKKEGPASFIYYRSTATVQHALATYIQV